MFNKEHLQWVVLSIISVALIVVIFFIAKQDQELYRISNTLQMMTATSPNPSLDSNKESQINKNDILEADGRSVVTKKSVTVNGKTISFIHLCDGTIQTAPEQQVSFCIGKNKLVTDAITTSDGRLYTISEETITEAEAAPVLDDVEPIRESDYILVSYPVSTCFNSDNCGAGMDTNLVTHVLSLGDTGSPVRSLNNYPGNGRPVWNASATKAIFIPDTCGGAGCGLEGLTGYNLASDAARSVSTEEAAWSPDGDVQNVDGVHLPLWKSVTWKTDSDFTASIEDPNGLTRKVIGTF